MGLGFSQLEAGWIEDKANRHPNRTHYSVDVSFCLVSPLKWLVLPAFIGIPVQNFVIRCKKEHKFDIHKVKIASFDDASFDHDFICEPG